MSNVDDISIVLKPTLDSKEINKEMRQIAQTSKTAIEQSFKSLDLTMKKSIEAWGGDVSKIGRNINMDSFIDDFRDKMQSLYSDIKDTGNLPLGMSSKLLDSMQNVDKLIGKYYQLLAVMGEMERSFTDTKNEQLAASQATIAQYKTFISGMKDISAQANKMIEGYKGYQSLLNGFSFTRGTKVYTGADALQDYESRKQKIEETRAKIAELQQAVNNGLIPSDRIKESNAEINRLEKSLRGLITTQSQFSEETKTAAEYLIGMRNSIAESTNFPDLREALTAENPIEALTNYSAEANMSIDTLTAGLERELQVQRNINDSTVEQNQYYSSVQQSVEELGVDIVKAASYVNELAEKSQRVASNMSQMRNVVWAISRVLGNVYTIGLDIVRTAKTVANIYKKIYGFVKNILGAFKKLRDHIKKTEDEHHKSWKEMLRDVVRYAFGIRSLFMLFRRLRRYIREAFEAMAEQIPEVNRVLSELKSSFNMLKGSLATALEPLLSAIARWLNILISKLATLMTYIGMFFAALTGRSYVYKANKSMTEFADSAGGAADNVKELNKQLQGFDELNNLTTNDKKDKDGGGGDSPLANFEKVDIPKWIKDLANLIKSIWDAIVEPIKQAWDAVKDYVIAAWKRAAKIILGFLLDIVRDFLRAWAKWGYPIFVRIFQIVGDIGMIIGNIAQALRDAWNANDNGYKIWSAILEIIYKVVDGIHTITQDMIDWTSKLNLTPAMTAFREWLESCIPVAETLMGILFDIWDKVLKRWLTWAFDGENSGIARFFKIIRDFNKKVNWKKLQENLQALWDAIGKFGETVGDGLLMFIQGLSDSLANWVNSKDFELTIDKIADFFNNFQPRDIKNDLEQIWRIIKNLAKAAWDVIKVIIDNKDKILNTLEWASKHIKGLIVTFITFKGAIDVGRLVANIYLMLTAIQKLAGGATIIEGLGKAFGALTSSLGLAVTGILAGVGLMAWSLKETFNQVDEEYDKLGGRIDTYNKINDNLQQNINDRTKAMEDLDATSSVVHSLVDELDNLQSKTSLSADEQARQKEIIDELNTVLPDLNLAIDDQTGKLNLSTEAILQNVDALIAQARVEAAREDLSQIAKDQYEAEKNLYNQKQDLKTAEEEYQKVLKESRDLDAELAEYGLTGNDLRFMGAKKAVDDLKEGIAETEETISTLNEEYNRTTGYINEYLSQSEAASTSVKNVNDNIKNGAVDLSDTTSQITTAVNDMSAAVNDTFPNLDKVPTDVAEKIKQASSTAKSTFEATNEEIANTTQIALDNIETFQSMLEDESFDWKSWFEGNMDEIDFSTVETSISNLTTTITDSMPDADEFKPFGENIPAGVAEGIKDNTTIATGAIDEFAQALVDAMHDSSLKFGSPSQTMIDFGKDIDTGIKDGITKNQNIALNAVDAFAKKITDKFAAMKNSIVGTFSNLASSIGDVLTKLSETLTDKISGIKENMKDLKNSVKNTSSSVGASFSISVPKLASGAVIPPNNEFLAVLGDQRRGVNIESPLSTIVDAFNAANKGGSEAEIALLQEQNELLRQLLQKEFGITNDAIFRSVRRSAQIFKTSTGNSAFA